MNEQQAAEALALLRAIHDRAEDLLGLVNSLPMTEPLDADDVAAVVVAALREDPPRPAD